MASIVYINRNAQAGAEAYNALVAIRNGIGGLERLDGLRAQAIGDSQTVMQTVFGTGTTAEAQALNDRWVGFLAAYNDSGNAEYAKLRDLVDALVAST
jgi:hypothetical protein